MHRKITEEIKEAECLKLVDYFYNPKMKKRVFQESYSFNEELRAFSFSFHFLMVNYYSFCFLKIIVKNDHLELLCFIVSLVD